MNVSESRIISPSRNHPAYEKHDLSQKRKVWVIGDLHGCFKLLEKGLRYLGYDETTDALVSVGDLVNRGEDNELSRKWMSRLLRVVGNHEELTVRAQNAGKGTDAFWVHYDQGGAWFWDSTSQEERETLATELWKAPVALEITTPGGNNVGIVHARVPGDNWETMREILKNPEHPLHNKTQFDAIWDRNHIEAFLRYGDTEPVSHIERVFFGHTPVRQITKNRNCVWTDTKAYRTKDLSIIDIDAWIKENPL